MTTPIQKAAEKLKRRLDAETAKATERKAALLTRHADDLKELAARDKLRRENILVEYSEVVQHAAGVPHA
mgnify:CR=1 FL=1